MRFNSFDEKAIRLTIIAPLLSFTLLFSGTSHSRTLKKNVITFGSEWTFTNWRVWFWESYYSQHHFLSNLKTEIASRCINSRACQLHGDTVKFKNGTEIYLKTDPGVIEINSSPVTVAGFEKNLNDISSFIFEAATAAKLHPHAFKGGGHIHFSAYQVLQIPLLLRNYISDFYNHVSTQAWAFLDYDGLNSKPLYDYPKKLRERYLKIIADFDKKDPSKLTLRDSLKLAHDIYTRVHFANKELKFAKYVPLNLKRLANFFKMIVDLPDLTEYSLKMHKVKVAVGAFGKPELMSAWDYLTKHLTIEIRSIRAQKNSSEYLKQIKLIEARLIMLSQKTAPISPQPFKRKGGRALRSEFRSYVEGAKLNWKDYEPFLKNMAFRTFLVCTMIAEGATKPFKRLRSRK